MDAGRIRSASGRDCQRRFRDEAGVLVSGAPW
jgi:hypothetical protein